MSTLVFVCPTTGQQISTGIEIDRASYSSLPRTKTQLSCPRCHNDHLLASVWAWLDSNDPQVSPAALTLYSYLTPSSRLGQASASAAPFLVASTGLRSRRGGLASHRMAE